MQVQLVKYPFFFVLMYKRGGGSFILFAAITIMYKWGGGSFILFAGITIMEGLWNIFYYIVTCPSIHVYTVI